MFSSHAQFLDTFTVVHDIAIQYKLTKQDGALYTNTRELNVNLVAEDGTTIYNEAVNAIKNPIPGEHDVALIKGIIAHNIFDVVKIKFNVVQDNKNSDNSGTTLSIFNIKWHIFAVQDIT